MTNKEYFEKTFGYDGAIATKVLPNEFGIGSCGYTDCRESCASRHFPRCPMWWNDELDEYYIKQEPTAQGFFDYLKEHYTDDELKE